jgi:hypothetical protein
MDWSPGSSLNAMARINKQEMVEHPNGRYGSEPQSDVFTRYVKTLE